MSSDKSKKKKNKGAAADLSGMTAVILCGGLGTRLREETEFKPKPMVQIGDQPILWHIMRIYRHFGVRHFVICLGYRGEVIREYFLRYRMEQSDFSVDLKSGKLEVLKHHAEDDWQVVLAETGYSTNTGGRALRALDYVKGDRFFLTYGDGLCDVDIAAVHAHHVANGKLATVTGVRPLARFGELQMADGMVESFLEKPQIQSGWINGGFFVFERAAFDGFKGDELSLERDILESIAARRQLAGYLHDGFWQCMDTYRETQLLNEMWRQGKAPWAY